MRETDQNAKKNLFDVRSEAAYLRHRNSGTCNGDYGRGIQK